MENGEERWFWVLLVAGMAKKDVLRVAWASLCWVCAWLRVVVMGKKKSKGGMGAGFCLFGDRICGG
ncbi:unnamed protein product [Prunus armeniaca]